MKFLMTNLVAAAAFYCLAGGTFAQDVEIESDVQESASTQTEMTIVAGDGPSPMIFSTSESIGPGGISSGVRIMSAGGPGGFTMMGDGANFAMPAPDPWSMLNNPSVQKDLELVGDQLKSVQDLQANFAEKMKEQIGDLSKGGINPDRFKGLGELMAKLRAEQQSQMEGLLLPHQIDRLKQVALQTHMQQSGTAGALVNEKVAEALEISDEQKDRLKARSKELKEKLEKDIEALKEKAKDDLLLELTPAQRSKLKDLVGDKYKPQTKDWAEQFQRRGSRRMQMKNNSSSESDNN